MSSLKKWRQVVAQDPSFDELTPIYHVPGFVEYVDAFYAEGSWPQLCDIGPVKFPSNRFLVTDGEFAFGFSLRKPNPAWPDLDEWEVTYHRAFGDESCASVPRLVVSASGRLLQGQYARFDGGERGDEDELEAYAIAVHAMAFSQLFRRCRDRIERVSVGRSAGGCCEGRGTAYTIRDLSTVLSHYKRLDEREVGMSRGRQRWHMRRGTWVMLGTDREHWRNPHEAGDSRIGRIVKDYSLPEYQPRERESR